MTLENTHCVDKRDFLLRIGPSGLDESLLVNVKVLCDCDCEQEDRIVKNAAECHGGDQVCGICRCKGGNVGKYCECNRPGMSTAALNEKCKRLNLLCSLLNLPNSEQTSRLSVRVEESVTVDVANVILEL